MRPEDFNPKRVTTARISIGPRATPRNPAMRKIDIPRARRSPPAPWATPAAGGWKAAEPTPARITHGIAHP